MGGGGKGTSKSTSAPPKEIMEAYKKSIGYAGQAISKPYEQYQGQLVAGLNPTQQQGIANVNAAQGVALPFIQQGAQYTNQAAQGVNPGMINQFMSPYLNTVVGATQRNLLESNAQQQNALKSQAIQSGAFGGDRARIGQAELARQQGLAGGQVIGGLMNQGFGQALAGAQQNVQNMLAGGQQLGSMGQAAQQSILQGAQAQLAAGAQQQATDQAFLQSAYDQFLQRQAFPFQQAQFYANIAQGIGAGAGGTTSQTPAAPNPFSQALGALTAIGTISDERAKENIEPIGKTNDGQTIYRYNYKGNPKTEIGLIAQEVEKTHPEAVGSLGGIKMVDLEAATENAAQRNGKALGGSSMGGLVTPGMERQAFAQGGFGGVPYADFFKGMSYVPGGELTYRGQSPGSTLPTGYKMEELQKMAEGSSFDELNAMSAEDVANLKKGFGVLGKGSGLMPSSDGAGGARAPTYSGPLSSFGPGVTSFFSSIGNAFGFAEGGVVPRHGYQTDGAVEFKPPSQEEVKQFIIDTAKAKGIDPEEALRVYYAEGLAGDPTENWQSKIVTDGKREESYGPFQLNMGPTGLGTAMLKQTGLDPRDPKNWQAGVDFSLAEAKKGGWKPWMGAKKIGLTGPATPFTDEISGVVAAAPPMDVGATPEPGVVPPPPADVNVEPAADTAPARSRSIIERILGQDMSDEARTGLLAAGLSIMGGTSPYFGVNVGKGGLAGLQTYYKGLENQRELAKARADITSTLATARSTEASAGTTELQNLSTLMRDYQKFVASYKASNKPYPSWTEFLEQRGQSGRGYEAFNPAVLLEEPAGTEAPAATPSPEAPNAPGAPEATTETEAPQIGVPDPVFAPEKAPSQVVAGVQQNYNFKKVMPNENPWLLMMGSPEDQAKAKDILQRGYALGINGENVNFRGGKQIETEAARVGEISNAFADAQAQATQTKEITRKIAQILQQEGSDRLTKIRGDLAGLLVGLRWGTEADVKNATTADLLEKLYAQLALTSGLQGAPTTAGIDKIRQVERGSGSPTLVGAAAREIIGSLEGQSKWQLDMAADWGKFVERHSNTGISSSMQSEWVQKWNAKLPEYVDWGMANTPVADPTPWQRVDGKINADNFKKGWKYVVPPERQSQFGKIVIYAGDGKFVRAE